MASTASTSALAISIFAAQDLYYNVRPSAAVGVFTCANPFDSLSAANFYDNINQFDWISINWLWVRRWLLFFLMLYWYLIYLLGITRSFLVYPTFAVYPQLMPQVQLFDVLHRSKSASLQKMRLKFFWIVFVGIFVWEWFPVCS